MHTIPQDWLENLGNELQQPYFSRLLTFLEREYEINTVFPKKEHIFAAFSATPLAKVKVLLLGQDPYHGEGQAHGLSFSVLPGQVPPPSLMNIYKELQTDLGCTLPKSGYLQPWARQGVLLLNTVLTVRAHEAGSHKGMGWETFTDAVIQLVNREDRPLVVFLWGKPAGAKKKLLTNPKHLILEAPHPSPLSVYRGFWGCKHFSRCNQFLEANGISPIDWQIGDE